MSNHFPLLFLSLALLTATAQAAQVTDLRSEYRQNPIGVDVLQPQLSWNLISSLRSDNQTAYQALVASTPEKLAANNGDLWNSGKVASSQSTYIRYAGAPLKSQMRCYWKVRVWDKNSQPSAWSPTASWTMGLLQPTDWSAKWITPSHWFVPPVVRSRGLDMVHSGHGWVDVDLGVPTRLDTVKLYPLDPQSFPLRFQILGSDEMQFAHPQVLVDKSAEDFHVSSTEPVEFSLGGKTARYVRLNIIASPNNHSRLRQMEIYSHGVNVALMKPTKEFGTEWEHGHAAMMLDGMPERGQGNDCPPDAISTIAAPLLRKSFTLPKTVKRATLYYAALGMADMTINGKKVSDDVLGPPFSDYTKRVYYVTKDITSLLAPGENVLGATLGNGYFSTPDLGFGQRQGGDGPPRLLAQADIVFTDGTTKTISTDSSWTWNRSEIVFDDLWSGYVEDRHQAKPGWDRPGYDAADWQSVSITHALGGKMVAAFAPPNRVVESIKPVRVDGNHAFFKYLSAGWPRVTVDGKAGQTITIGGSGGGVSLPTMAFILATDGLQVLEPRFVLFSQPTQIDVGGLSAPLTADQVTVQFAHADLKPTGAFHCSNPYVNKVYDATLRTQMNYVYDVPADPTREKQGWTQDAQNMFETAAYFDDVAAYYRRWLGDMQDSQDPDGYIPSVVPLVGRQEYGWDSPWWSGASVLLPWQHYLFYGNQRILAESYVPMKNYVDFLGKFTDAGLRPGWDDYPYLTNNPDPAAHDGMLWWNGAGDWMNPYNATQNVVPTPMTTMPAWYYYATIVSKTAAMLGKTADAEHYAAVAKMVQERFNAKYFHPDTGLYGDELGNETAQILPLAVGIVPPGKESLVYQRLIDAIHARQDHLGTGFVALPFLLHILTDARNSELVNKIINQQDYPSWNTLMHDGILGEGWKGENAQMPSTGGSFGMWCFQSVLGIRPDPEGPGFAKFIVAPQPDPATGLTSAEGYYDSVHGRIISEWNLNNSQFTLHTTVPANTTATVYIPISTVVPLLTPNPKQSVTESGQPAASAMGVKFLRVEGNAAVYLVGSGDYHFSSALFSFRG